MARVRSPHVRSIAARPRDVLLAVSVAVAIAAAHLLYMRQGGELTVQAQLNERFAERPIGVAFEKYPRLRPPLYPMALWGARRVGLSSDAFQLLVFDAFLIGLALYGRKFLRAVHPAFLAVGFAVAHFNHVNLYQRTAETLFAPLLVLFAVVLWRYRALATGTALVGLALAASALSVTRHFGLFLSVPLAVAHVLARRATEPRRRIAHAVVVFLIALAPIGCWSWITYEQTGFWTGTDRTRDRDLPEAVEHWRDLDGVDDHVRLTAKTLLVDFFSPRSYGALSVVTRPHRPTAVEWGMLALAITACVSAIRVGRRAGWAADAASPARTLGQVAGAYLLLTLAVWTAGNNDPIHTRFLFPAYGLLWVLAFHGYDAVRGWNATRWERLPWQLLFAGFVALQATRAWRAEPLPVRYLW